MGWSLYNTELHRLHNFNPLFTILVIFGYCLGGKTKSQRTFPLLKSLYAPHKKFGTFLKSKWLPLLWRLRCCTSWSIYRLLYWLLNMHAPNLMFTLILILKLSLLCGLTIHRFMFNTWVWVLLTTLYRLKC